jgi:hypothetical protein
MTFKAYLPDFLIPQYDVLRDTLLSWLQILGFVKGPSTAISGQSSFYGIVCVH